ncbi:MAG: type II toxin-antitoxin system RelE family toxin [Dehalococcoidia bacterium]
MTDFAWSSRAIDDLMAIARLDFDQASRINDAMQLHARTRQGDVVKLAGRRDEWRLRVGKWRVIYTRHTDGTLEVLAIRDRRDAYE